MSSSAILLKKIKKRKEFSIAIEKAKKHALTVQKKLIELNNKNDCRSNEQKINTAIDLIKNLKKEFNQIPNLNESLKKDGLFVCRSIRESFNKLTGLRKYYIDSSSKIALNYVASELRLFIPKDETECYFMFKININDISIPISIPLLELNKVKEITS